MQSWNSTETPHEHADIWEAPLSRDNRGVVVATVLIVDDEECIAQLLGEFLESVGYHVLLAGNGRAALTLARVFLPALVLTDMVMPEMDGPELLDALRASPKTRNIPVVLMSSTRPATRALREVPFIAKPFDLDVVLDQVVRHARPRTNRIHH